EEGAFAAAGDCVWAGRGAAARVPGGCDAAAGREALLLRDHAAGVAGGRDRGVRDAGLEVGVGATQKLRDLAGHVGRRMPALRIASMTMGQFSGFTAESMTRVSFRASRRNRWRGSVFGLRGGIDGDRVDHRLGGGELESEFLLESFVEIGLVGFGLFGDRAKAGELILVGSPVQGKVVPAVQLGLIDNG